MTPLRLSLYHKIVATRKSNRSKHPVKTAPGPVKGSRRTSSSAGAANKPPISWAVLFWLAFAIFIFGLFLFNREEITGGIDALKKELALRNDRGGEPPVPGPEPVTDQVPPPPAMPQPPNTAPEQPNPAPVQPESPAIPAPPASPAASTPAPQPARQPSQPSSQTAAARPPAQTSPAGTARPPAQPAAQTPAREQRDRALYFIQVDRGGSILRVQVNRKLPVSDSPMTDVIQALISGPNGEEKQKGLISLIPPATKILSATVRGNTAYISFSEDFQYNTYGVEGYAGQLRQIVFTATEFSNVRDVQILIEGRRLDYLGEGIWIGSPLNRDML